MLVLVRYNDDNYDIIDDYRLEYLIVTGKVTGFSRSDTWVSVGTAPTREKNDTDNIRSYAGPERRNPQRNLLHMPHSPANS